MPNGTTKHLKVGKAVGSLGAKQVACELALQLKGPEDEKWLRRKSLRNGMSEAVGVESMSFWKRLS